MIYEIVCNITNEKYYGSTTMKERRRLDAHKCNKNGCTSKSIIDRGDYTFRILERLENPTKLELLLKEKEYIINNECINKLIPAQTEEEINENIKKNKYRYYRENLDKFKQYGIEWYSKNSEKRKQMTNDYYKNNRDKILEKRREGVVCECGVNYTIQNRARHQKTKHHITFIEAKDK